MLSYDLMLSYDYYGESYSNTYLLPFIFTLTLFLM